MTLEAIIAANKASALESEAEQRERADLKASYQASDLFQLSHRSHRTFIGEADTRDSTLNNIERENVEASRNN